MSSANLLTPSAEFKKQAIRSLSAIIGFLLLYLLLVAASVALAVASFYAGITVISVNPGIWTLLAGLGIMAVGVMVVVFLIKFLFASSTEDHSDSVEITEEDHPQLFAAIYELAQQTGTSRPKKVFLSPDVNACVFYHSSFWSMFLPVRKNLKIGLGLVNSVNASELRAVIAHEFGHFSQRSMKLGSWVYQVNKIIHNMLYNNNGYSETLGAISSVHGILAIFAHITVGIVRAIQWILQQMYKVVNKSYLGLSRQMEFHADLMAASVCGSNNIVSSLYRIEFAEHCYQNTIHFCNEAFKQKKRVPDFYAGHTAMLRHAATLNGFAITAGLPQVVRNNNTVNRVNFKNQWASHPTIQEREAYLQPFALEAAVDERSAWVFFTDAGRWKEQLTAHIYGSASPHEMPDSLDGDGFSGLLQLHMKQVVFPKIFGEYYNHEIKPFDAEAVAHEPYTITPLEQWFGEEQRSLPSKLETLDQDIVVLQGIADKTIDTSSFDFDGQKLKRNKAPQIKTRLEGEKKALLNSMELLDKKLFRHAYAVAPLTEAEGLKRAYISYFELRKEADELLTRINNMMNSLLPIFRGETLQLANLTIMINELKAHHEPLFKGSLSLWLDRGVFDTDPVLKEKMQNYIAANWVYFFEGNFIGTEFTGLHTIVQEAWAAVSHHVFSVFRDVTVLQAELMEAKEQAVLNH